MKFLDLAGVQYLVNKLKSTIKLVEVSNTYTTGTAETVSYTVPDYTPGVDTLGVYVNGLKLIKGTDYTISNTTVTLTKELDSGQVCEFVVTKVEFS